MVVNIWGDDYLGSEGVVDDVVRRVGKKMGGLKVERI